MTEQELNQANELKAQIREVRNFLEVFNSNMNEKRGDTKLINGLIEITHKTEVRISGKRWFGMGTHKTDVEIPMELVRELEMIFEWKLKKLETEFKALV